MACLIFLCCHTRLFMARSQPRFVTSSPNTANIHNALWCSITCSITCSFFSLESLRSSYFSCVTHCSKTLWHKITIYSAHGFSGSGIRTGHSGDDLSLPPWRMFGLRPGNTKAGNRNHLKARSLMCLVVGAHYRLEASVSLHMSLFMWSLHIG